MKVFAIVIALIAGSFACFSNACAQDNPKVTGSADFCVETSIDQPGDGRVFPQPKGAQIQKGPAGMEKGHYCDSDGGGWRSSHLLA